MKVEEDNEGTSVSAVSEHRSTQKHADKTELEKDTQSLLKIVRTTAEDMSITREISMATFVTNV